jgi:hypothetical protein
MPTPMETIEAQALKLPPDQRFELIDAWLPVSSRLR